jgi:hypothetical protein
LSFALNEIRSQNWFRRAVKFLIAVTGAVFILADGVQTRADNANLPLLQKTDLVYQGAFRVPFNSTGEDTKTLSYGGTAPVFNPVRNSLFLVGHDQTQLVCEISIPKLVNSSNMSDLNTAQLIQNPAQVVTRIKNLAGIDSQAKIGGLQTVNGKLVGTFYEWYDADASAKGSHFIIDDPANLNGSSVIGLCQIRAIPADAMAGYMSAVPTEWQRDLGAPYLTGLAGGSIISRSSYGPAAVGLDLARLGVKTAPGVAYLDYPKLHPLGDYDSRNSFFNMTTKVRGVIFFSGTRTILFFGTHAFGVPFYGEASDCNDPNRGGKGTHVVGGKYLYYVWAYDASEFVALKDGYKRPWQIKPYAVWSLDNLPFATGAKEIGGAAYDPASGTICLSALNADRHGQYAYLPVIHGFKVATGRTEPTQ